MINHIPSNPSTLYTIMMFTKQLTNALEKEISVYTVDQQPFAPSQEIRWSRPEEFKNHFMRLGGFLCRESLGKRWVERPAIQF